MFSTKQHAIVIVYGYPYILCTEDFLEHLAEANQEPNKDSFVLSAKPKAYSMAFAKSWSKFDDYVELVASTILHHYVPLSVEDRSSKTTAIAETPCAALPLTVSANMHHAAATEPQLLLY